MVRSIWTDSGMCRPTLFWYSRSVKLGISVPLLQRQGELSDGLTVQGHIHSPGPDKAALRDVRSGHREDGQDPGLLLPHPPAFLHLSEPPVHVYLSRAGGAWGGKGDRQDLIKIAVGQEEGQPLYVRPSQVIPDHTDVEIPQLIEEEARLGPPRTVRPAG